MSAQIRSAKPPIVPISTTGRALLRTLIWQAAQLTWWRWLRRFISMLLSIQFFVLVLHLICRISIEAMYSNRVCLVGVMFWEYLFNLVWYFNTIEIKLEYFSSFFGDTILLLRLSVLLSWSDLPSFFFLIFLRACSFDLRSFQKEANRILRSNGVLAIWSGRRAGIANNAKAEALLQELCDGDDYLGPYWSEQSLMVNNEYASIALDSSFFQAGERQQFSDITEWSIKHLVSSSFRHHWPKDQSASLSSNIIILYSSTFCMLRPPTWRDCELPDSSETAELR